MQWIFFEQVIGYCQRAGVIQILLARGSIGLKRIDNLNLALIQRSFTGFPHIEIDQHLIIRGHSQALNSRSRQTNFSQCRPDGIVIRRVRELYIDQRAAPEVYTQRDAMPEQHRQYPRHAEQKRKGEKIPLLTQKVYVRISKKFHAVVNTPCSLCP